MRFVQSCISNKGDGMGSEVNELHTQEHWMMIQADLLEQSYGLDKW